MKEYNSRILKAKQAIKQADYIIIGAGSGLSTAAGLLYNGEKFEKDFKEFIENITLIIYILHHFMNLKHKKKNGHFLQK